jgi:hypothetical protein
LQHVAQASADIALSDKLDMTANVPGAAKSVSVGVVK